MRQYKSKNNTKNHLVHIRHLCALNFHERNKNKLMAECVFMDFHIFISIFMTMYKKHYALETQQFSDPSIWF